MRPAGSSLALAFKTCISFLVLLGAVTPTQAACPTATTRFQAYQADINGDGLPDLIFVPVPTVIVVPLGDNGDPIPLVTDVGLPGFNYLSSSAPVTVPGVPAGAVAVSYQSSVQPADASGCGAVVLRGLTAGLPTLVASFSGTPGVAPSLIQVLNSAASTSPRVSYSYDARNRLRNTTYGDGSPGISRSYTADGLLSTISTGGTNPSTWSYGYNNRRLLTSESLSLPGVGSTIQRFYDANAHLSQLTYPGGTAVAYAPDALGEPTQVSGFASAVAWAPNGRLASFTYANGIAHSVSQNTRGLPQQANDSGVIQDGYSYDADGDVTAITDGLPGGISSRSMGYDGLDRLNAANSPGVWGNASYGYDPLDNLRSSIVGSRSSSMGYGDGTNRLTQIVTNGVATNYGYDAQGNITTKGTTQGFLFDVGNRLLASGSASYAYDGLGRRTIANSANGAQRVQMYSQDGQLLYGTYKPAGGAASGVRYIYLDGKVIAEADATGNSNVRFLHTDGLGSPVARTNATGALIDRTRYEPYGATASGTNPGTAADNIGFTGHANDPATGLVYMQQRYYDPIAGRFLSVDPVTTDANTGKSFDRYYYANNSPYKYIDPDGNDSIIFQFGASAVFGVGVEGSAGIYITGFPSPDIGVFASGGYGSGANVGLAAQVGVIPGPTSNISGDTSNTNVSTVILSGTVMRDPNTGNIVGGTVGPGAKLGVSQTSSTTGTAGLRGLLMKIFEKLFPNPTENNKKPKPEAPKPEAPKPEAPKPEAPKSEVK